MFAFYKKSHMKQFKRIMMMLLMAVLASSTMMAADWAFYELKGKVKSVTTTEIDSRYGEPFSFTKKFTAAGKVIMDKGTKVTRNKKGRIIKISVYSDEIEPMWLSTKYKYNSKGQVVSSSGEGLESYGSTTYEYDYDGRLAKVMQSGETEGTPYTSINVYTYNSFDSKGNWTKCTIKSTILYDNNEYPTETSTITQTRKIVYYK